MSKSRRRSVRSSVSSNSKRPQRNLPWVKHGRDYGPARAAIEDLLTWAFELAALDVADWPQAERRVDNARKWVIAHLSGKNARLPLEDVTFTAALLIRIFDDDFGLDLSEVITILDVLGLPTEHVPLLPRRNVGAAGRASALASITPLRSRMNAKPAERGACEECSRFCPHVRNAA